MKRLEKKPCSKCGERFAPGMLSRWHGENCKPRPYSSAAMRVSKNDRDSRKSVGAVSSYSG
jgi:hypothetical protein